MDPLNAPFFHFRWVLKLLTWHKCHCSHPVYIRDSNHTHCLTSLQLSRLLANGRPYRARKWPHRQKWRPYMARRPFSKPVRAHEERNGPPGDDQGLSTAKPGGTHVTLAQGWNPPTSPCPALSAGAERKFQGNCRKWRHKLKVVWRQYASIAYNRLRWNYDPTSLLIDLKQCAPFSPCMSNIWWEQ